MNLQQLRYFVALCEERNFVLAARRCGVSQPSLTHSIRMLEETWRTAVQSKADRSDRAWRSLAITLRNRRPRSRRDASNRRHLSRKSAQRQTGNESCTVLQAPAAAKPHRRSDGPGSTVFFSDAQARSATATRPRVASTAAHRGQPDHSLVGANDVGAYLFGDRCGIPGPGFPGDGLRVLRIDFQVNPLFQPPNNKRTVGMARNAVPHRQGGPCMLASARKPYRPRQPATGDRPCVSMICRKATGSKIGGRRAACAFQEGAPAASASAPSSCSA